MTFSITVGATGFGIFIQNIQPAGDNFQNPPVWTSSDPTTLALGTPINNGQAVPVTALKPGTVTVTCVGDGVTETANGTVTAPAVTGFDLVFGPMPPTTPPAA